MGHQPIKGKEGWKCKHCGLKKMTKQCLPKTLNKRPLEGVKPWIEKDPNLYPKSKGALGILKGGPKQSKLEGFLQGKKAKSGEYLGEHKVIACHSTKERFCSEAYGSTDEMALHKDEDTSASCTTRYNHLNDLPACISSGLQRKKRVSGPECKEQSAQKKHKQEVPKEVSEQEAQAGPIIKEFGPKDLRFYFQLPKKATGTAQRANNGTQSNVGPMAGVE